jgi:hypothetical protein
MEISTKYSLGDEVYPISRHKKRVVSLCPTCCGDGVVHINGKEFSCPDCHGKGVNTIYCNEQWNIEYNIISPVGRVGVELYAAKYNEGGDRDTIRYMLESTGVGNGTLWYEDDLFPSAQLAQEACDVRNANETGATK